MSSSASLASSSSPPVIPASLASSSASLASSSAGLASSSIPPVIPASLASSSASVASPSGSPVMPVDEENMSNSSSLASSSSPTVIPMDRRLRELLKACRKDDFSLCTDLIDANPDILLFTTHYSNNCLHTAAMLGHEDFAKEVWSRAPTLLFGTNDDGETPLMAALMAANLSLASNIITAATQYMQHDGLEEGRPLNRMLLKVDRCKENVLHHAMRNNFEDFALQLLDIEPQLSMQATNTGESPMYMAARRGYSKIVERLLEIPFSADSGPRGDSALHAAAKFQCAGIAEQILERRPQLAYRKDVDGYNPLHRATLENNIDLVKILLEYEPNLAYTKGGNIESTPFIMAAEKGYLSIVEEIMGTCPNSVYIADKDGDNALHNAILFEKPDIINYILGTPNLHRLINQANNEGRIPLFCAAEKCDPKLLRSLLSLEGQDYTAVNVFADQALDIVYGKKDLWKTLQWNESFTLLSNVIPSSWNYEIRDDAKQTIKKQAIQELKSLTTKYISNTSLVAALLATITFATAFTLPGGFGTDTSNAGQPLFARKAAFQVFLITDTIAMCSSLSVAFLCILATWEDLDYLLNYRKTTRALMWCAYVATALAFGTGLFTVLAPNNLWLAILILVLCTILPLFSKIIGDWPLLMLRYRLRGLFRKELIPNI